MKKWVTRYAPLYSTPSVKSPVLLYIPEKHLIETVEESTGSDCLIECNYHGRRGWIHSQDCEEYIESYPRNCVPSGLQTIDQWDAEQYVNVEGARQVNLCGEWCVARCLGVSLDELLTTWKRKETPIYKRIFQFGKVAQGTGIADLKSMFAAYDLESESLFDCFKLAHVKYTKYTPDALRRLVDEGDVICGVHITGGRLAPSGIPHWVVAESVIPERCGYGLVSVYNPYFNRIELYSWNEFITSARNPAGVWVGS